MVTIETKTVFAAGVRIATHLGIHHQESREYSAYKEWIEILIL